EDADALVSWIGPASEGIQRLCEAMATADPNASLLFGLEQNKAYRECERLQAVVTESSQRLFHAASRICAIIDRTEERQPAKPEGDLSSHPAIAVVTIPTPPLESEPKPPTESELLQAMLRLKAFGPTSARSKA